MATSAPVRGAGGVPGTDNAFGSRFAYIEKLVERSSVARRVEASANDEAKAKQQTARSFYRQAQDAHKAGNDKLALELLNGAIRNMGEAAQMAARNEIVEEKRRQDFQTRLETVHALFAAHDRISSEVGAKENTDPFHSLIQQKVSQAERLYASGGVISARSHLDEAYGALTVAIEGLRGGRTLVHELYFATKQDEYKYEFDRNRSHRMLVKLLLEDTMHSNPSTAQVVLGLMSKADKARAIAARYAETGRYTAAISAMEKSTGHIVRAIRDAGVYIPG
jgi:hypothetical protein